MLCSHRAMYCTCMGKSQPPFFQTPPSVIYYTKYFSPFLVKYMALTNN